MTNLIHEIVDDMLIIYVKPVTQECKILEWVRYRSRLPFTDEIIRVAGMDNIKFEVIAVKDREYWHEVYVRVYDDNECTTASD